jgi:hypothetical protein
MALKRIIASLFHASAPVSVTEKIVRPAAFLGIFLTALLSSARRQGNPLMITSGCFVGVAVRRVTQPDGAAVAFRRRSIDLGLGRRDMLQIRFPADSWPGRQPWPWPSLP